MFRVASFDVGVRSLSMCIIRLPKKEQDPFPKMEIEYWECVDLLKDQEIEVKNSKKISLQRKNECLMKALSKRSWQFFHHQLDYVLIENQPLKRTNRKSIGSIDNKVLSYSILNFFEDEWYYRGSLMKMKRPKCIFVSPELKLTYDLLQRFIGTSFILEESCPEIKMKQGQFMCNDDYAGRKKKSKIFTIQLLKNLQKVNQVNELTKHWIALYLGSNMASKKFHHPRNGDDKSQDRRSDLADCFLQCITYYTKKIAKLA